MELCRPRYRAQPAERRNPPPVQDCSVGPARPRRWRSLVVQALAKGRTWLLAWMRLLAWVRPSAWVSSREAAPPLVRVLSPESPQLRAGLTLAPSPWRWAGEKIVRPPLWERSVPEWTSPLRHRRRPAKRRRLQLTRSVSATSARELGYLGGIYAKTSSGPGKPPRPQQLRRACRYSEFGVLDNSSMDCRAIADIRTQSRCSTQRCLAVRLALRNLARELVAA